ncbi:MAG: hypothetical protein JSV95_00315 [Gemmatimonadota bacterium]|jgi:hypothetical protein|nr:MAG: hypothetical protein JSV95_00315 [Gemmatimonadota bacterium]
MSGFATCRFKRLVAVIPLAAVALLPGCGDISEFIKPITPAEISGEWRATDFVVTNPSDPTQSFDALAEGFSLFLRFSIDGDFQSIIQYPGVPDAVDTGTYEIVDDFILVVPDVPPPDTVHFAYEFQTSKTAFSLTLLSDDWTFDFDGDGTEEPALLFTIVIR